jgi:5-methylthioribose kinase
MRARAQTILTEADLPALLAGMGLVPSGAALEVEPAGDGNINWVRRVRAPDGASWIVKQARLQLERFPEYRAPTERIVCERRYYEVAAPLDAEAVCPEVLGFDEVDRVLVLGDLGGAERLDHALGRGANVAKALAAVARFLGRVHAATRDPGLAERFENDGMRRLHGEHIFVLPLRPNDFPLPEEIRARASALGADASLVGLADESYARYLEPRGALVHGDVQGGNVLLTRTGPKLLDAEISHVGDPAFDVGTLAAHVLLAGAGRARLAAARDDVAALWDAYRGATDAPPRFADVARYAGLEVLRRTIGAARVAATAEPTAALSALELATRLIRTPPETPEGVAAS